MKRSIAVLAVLALSGCAITSREATMDLPGTSWVLADLDGEAPVGETPPSLAFDDAGGASGTTGCNQYNGEVTIEGNDLSFGPLATTRMACIDNATAAQEQAFVGAMQSVTSYTIDDEGRLVLEGEGTLTFEVAPEEE